MERQFEYRFEWDPAKALRNARAHGVSFDRATSVFLDPRALSVFDAEHSENEERWVTLGLDSAGVLLVVCHTFRAEKESARDMNAKVRLISARRADRREAAQYGEN